jgi:hypothetical protein
MGSIPIVELFVLIPHLSSLPVFEEAELCIVIIQLSSRFVSPKFPKAWFDALTGDQKGKKALREFPLSEKMLVYHYLAPVAVHKKPGLSVWSL